MIFNIISQWFALSMGDLKSIIHCGGFAQNQQKWMYTFSGKATVTAASMKSAPQSWDIGWEIERIMCFCRLRIYKFLLDIYSHYFGNFSKVFFFFCSSYLRYENCIDRKFSIYCFWNEFQRTQYIIRFSYWIIKFP